MCKKKETVNTIDFDETLLPHNRKEQFFSIAKTKYLKILAIGALIILFSLPSMVISLLKIFALTSIYSNYTEGQELEMVVAARNAYLLYDGIQIIGAMILAVGIAGAMKVIKSLCFDEIYFLKTDFVKGIKENSKHYIIISVFFSLMVMLFNFLFFTSTLNNNESMKIVSVIFLGLFIFALVPIFVMMISSVCIYQNTFAGHFRNSLVITIKHYFPYMLFGLVFALGIIGVYVLANVVSNGGLFLPITALILLYLCPLFLLANHLYCLSRFDLYINKNEYQVIYRKGLAPEEKKDNK